ncbi:sigma-70 family RNA polymerase sigma factor [Butyricimonas paravirosa]|nr:sigma-70 family RNA polymerase sigma factor [Butyricimonas paravirosa]
MAVDYDMNSSVLIDDFNRRDNHAFEYIFLHLYDALYRFGSKLYVGTEVIPDDVVQDVFMNVLKSRVTFESMEHLKAYLYLSMKNSYRRYWSHQQHVNSYMNHVKRLSEDEMEAELVTSEVITYLSQAIEILPEEYAAVLKMYIEGFSPAEIAEQLGIALSTVYKRKDKAVEDLKKRLPSNMLTLFLSFL